MKRHTKTAKTLLRNSIKAAPAAMQPRREYHVIGLDDGAIWVCPRSADDQAKLRQILILAGWSVRCDGEPGTSGEWIIETRIP